MLLLVNLLGGIGLFLLGMTMLTDGLKLAAGGALERILAAWTRTRLYGLLTGILVTALVQSSTAMTVAAKALLEQVDAQKQQAKSGQRAAEPAAPGALP